MSGDPNIPRKGRATGNAAERQRMGGPTWGWFVDYGADGLKLTDSSGNLWPAERVRMLTGPFGYNAEGMHAAPRSRVYAADEVVVDGDCYLIEFLHGDPQKPVLIGGVRTIKPDDTEFFPVPAIGTDPNPKRLRMAAMDGNGVVTGHVQIRALDGGTTFELVVGGAAFGTGLRVLIDHTAGTISLGNGVETHAAPLGDVIVQALLDLATDIATVAAAVPVVLPVPPLAGAAQVAVDAAASLAVGPPMLSTVVKTS